MHRVLFTERARADLDRLHAFLDAKSPRAAKRAVQRIIEGIDLLALFPRSGVIVKGDLRNAFIRFGHSRYVVRYKIDADTVLITRIWHGKEARK
ncbi:type II toxin-antitoxin system RelE/ParE family toxin [Terricaulis silvestris]|uniref:Toxin RelE1 n=1 Tax=Terricaulis silvestris TaxID=2686094 RepID=A0A6I6MXC6_9CAUL|nr:type II toxin-antitoxin system RelE/ParE family toxin [Terricaulis silvestris]QGZ96272.1 Toxin RelE1 [Terricaulis silvestris]